MRVIAGMARGARLVAPPGERPTMDRVRAAVFSMLGDGVPGARVLDLFAGSGAYGIEALSRGARAAVFVDSSRASLACLRRNLAAAKMHGAVQAMDAFRFLETYAPLEPFDLVFADPPYASKESDIAARLLASGLLAPALRAEGVAVVERRAGGSQPISPGLELLTARRYGGTEILLLRRP